MERNFFFKKHCRQKSFFFLPFLNLKKNGYLTRRIFWDIWFLKDEEKNKERSSFFCLLYKFFFLEYEVFLKNLTFRKKLWKSPHRVNYLAPWPLENVAPIFLCIQQLYFIWANVFTLAWKFRFLYDLIQSLFWGENTRYNLCYPEFFKKK